MGFSHKVVGKILGDRKSKNAYSVQGRYPGPHGWEDVTEEESREEAYKRKKEYDENEPGTPHRVVRSK